MKNKYVDNVKPYSDRMSFKEIDLFLDWNESDLIWKDLLLG